MVKEKQDIIESNCLKEVSDKVIVDKKRIKDSWKEYMQQETSAIADKPRDVSGEM